MKVKAIFDTIQGEGARAGTRAIFVRFTGCNLWSGLPTGRMNGNGACARWCDTDFFGGEDLDVSALAQRMHALWPHGSERWCVLTGGEPSLQVTRGVVAELQHSGWRVAMETNGTKDVSGLKLDWLTVSPKIGGALVQKEGSELKIVLPGAVGHEPGWSENAIISMGELFKIKYVVPMDPPLSQQVEDTHLHRRTLTISNSEGKKHEDYKQLCIKFVQRNPDWRIGMQLHKAWGLP